MVQLSVNVDGQKDPVKKPPETVQVPIAVISSGPLPEKPDRPVAVKKGRRCSKRALCVTTSVVILVALVAAFLAVRRCRHDSSDLWEDEDGDNGVWHSGDGPHGDGPHGEGLHGNQPHHDDGGHDGDEGDDDDDDDDDDDGEDQGGQGGEAEDDGHRYRRGNEGRLLLDGRA